MYKRLATDLVKVFNENAYLAIVINNTFNELNLSLNDKKIYTKIIYGVVEKRLLLDYNLASLIKGKRVKPLIKNILRIGVYVIDYMNMKDHFIVNELVSTIKKTDYKSAMFINGVLRSYQRVDKPSLDKLSELERLSIELSIPIDLCSMLYKQYGNKMKDFFVEGNSYNSYRINTLKTNVSDVLKVLDSESIKYEINGVNVLTKDTLINHELFKNGLIIAQDSSSIRVGEIVNPVPGSSVLDVCSAPGGKSMHMAAIMNNTGSITSCDVYDHKLEKINANAAKLGVSIVNTILADGTSYNYNNTYDYVLADVPCSGLGVIGHKPDLKYHLTIKDIEDINALQKQIINHVKNFVKNGGYLIYSTCTINKLENEWFIKDFLRENKEFIKIEEEIILPNSKQDGFYICKMRKEVTNE